MNPSARLKENLEAEEIIKLLNTPCLNEEVKEGFVFSYTGLRFVDAKSIQWADIPGEPTDNPHHPTQDRVPRSAHLTSRSHGDPRKKKRTPSHSQRRRSIPVTHS